MLRRGFSILELTLVLVLMLTLAGLSCLHMRRPSASAQNRAAAEQLLSLLGLARQQAISRGYPVGVGLPTQAGSWSHCASAYLLEGEVFPRLTRVVDFAAQGSGARLFVGTWPLDSGHSATPLAVAAAGSGERFTLADWHAPFPQDRLYIYLPSGALVSNSPAFDEAYHVVVSHGLRYSGSSLSQTHAPWTVVLSPNGACRLKPGLVAGSTVATSPHSLEADIGAPAPTIASLGPNQVPTMQVRIHPKPVAAALPPGIDATLNVERYLTLEVRARDQDGDTLYCRWAGNGTLGPGQFSFPQEQRMDWDADAQEWVGYTTWACAPDDMGGPSYQLLCQVDDHRGGVIQDTFGLAGTVQSLNTELIAYEGRSGGMWDIWVMNTDGSDSRRLTLGANAQYPEWSPDGKVVAYLGPGGIWVVNRDGSGRRALVIQPNIAGAIFSSEGAQLYYAARASGPSPGGVGNFYRVSLNDGNPPVLITSIPDTSRTWLGLARIGGLDRLFLDQVSSSWQHYNTKMLTPATGVVVDVLRSNGLGIGREFNVNPQGTWVCWGDGVNIGQLDPTTWTVHNIQKITPVAETPKFSASGSQLVFQDPDPTYTWRIDLTGANRIKLTNGNGGQTSAENQAVWSSR